MDWIPASGRYSGVENGNPLQCSCLGNPMDREAWWTAVHEVAKESDTTERTSTPTLCMGQKNHFFPVFQRCLLGDSDPILFKMPSHLPSTPLPCPDLFLSFTFIFQRDFIAQLSRAGTLHSDHLNLTRGSTMQRVLSHVLFFLLVSTWMTFKIIRLYQII